MQSRCHVPNQLACLEGPRAEVQFTCLNRYEVWVFYVHLIVWYFLNIVEVYFDCGAGKRSLS